ncbi:MAG: hypothetical protein HY331_06505, partial [Chloroflexi bacterium]|nr:hypothetical protein [Chloroflexota bacterium]
MARSGGFGGGLSPFGGGSLGGIGQYDIGADLADLDVYRTEVAWGNGQATDDDYLAALRKALAATDPDTQRQATAQNKLDDAVYRVGRSVAEAGGLDALIAFDQAALATMNPSNLRYRDVKDSLQSEMAQRRSRDYGELVTAYNDGDLPTETLLAWVSSTLGTISPDDPDFNNWTNVRGDLTDRMQGEKDTQVFQDYQRGRMEPAAFLAYLTSRRDEYGPNTPKYQEWANKLEDATVQVKEAAQSKADSTFFALYEEGKKSDASYLLYLRRRIDTMPADDPQRGEWQHRLNQAAFSLAEDKLRFDAQRAGDRVDAAKKPTAAMIRAASAAGQKLLDFYTSYRGTLNPGSAEWRNVTRSIDTLSRQLAAPPPKPRSGTAGGAKTGPGTAPGAAIGPGPALTGPGGKVISPKYTLSNILGLFSINPAANKKAVSAATKYLALNMSTLNNALNRGDDVWLFSDPRNPGALVAAQNPDGSPVLDAKGKPVLVRGSAYLPVASEAFSNLKTVEASNFMSSAEVALAKGKYGDYASLLRRAGESLDSARLQDAQYREQNWEDWYKATEVAVDKMTMAGQYGDAIRLATDLAARLASEAQNPYLDDTRRTRLDEIGQKLADNKIMPTADEQGKVLYEGAVNLAELSRGNTVLNPGWRHVLKTNDRGQPDWGPVFDPYQDGRWEEGHVTVHTTLGDKLVTGDAVKSKASKLDPTIRVLTADGYKDVVAGGTAEMLSFVDEYGQVQRAYSIDGGGTWIRPASGMPAPTVEINANLTAKTDAKGVISYVDESGEVALTEDGAGGWTLAEAWTEANPQALMWYGQAAWEQARRTPAGKQQLEFDSPFGREARRLSAQDATQMPMGGIGQHMTLAFASPSGIVNLVPAGFRTVGQIQTDKRRSMSGRVGPSPITGALTGNLGREARPRPADTRASLLDEQGLRRSLASRPVSYADIAAQLPADTPPRYDGYTIRPPAPVVARVGPSRSLPGLTTPPVYRPMPSRGVIPA